MQSLREIDAARRNWREAAIHKGTYVKEGQATALPKPGIETRQAERRRRIVAARHAGGGFRRSQWREVLDMVDRAANP